MAELQAEVLVVGAGPAGCSAALTLAAQGHSVIVCERLPLPQVKTCGDVLLPDALCALERLGLDTALRSAGKALERLLLTAPNGLELELPLSTLTLPRTELHALLHARLRACGIDLRRGEVLEPLRNAAGSLVGVRCRTAGEEVEVRAPLVILASGARPETLKRFGLCLRETPTAVAIRAEYRDRSRPEDDALRICLHRAVTPGFGWIFPLPDQHYNIGCGHFLAPGEQADQLYLRNRLDFFGRAFPPACQVVAEEDLVATPCSAVLRTGLTGARLFDDGLLVAGEAAGSNSPLTGDGIGKALVCGEEAGRVANEALAARRYDAAFLARYEERLESRFGVYYRACAKGQTWLSSPERLDTLIRKAVASEKLRTGLTAVLSEARPPTDVVSFWTFFLP